MFKITSNNDYYFKKQVNLQNIWITCIQQPKKVQSFQTFISNSIKRFEKQLIKKYRDFKINITPNNTSLNYETYTKFVVIENMHIIDSTVVNVIELQHSKWSKLKLEDLTTIA